LKRTLSFPAGSLILSIRVFEKILNLSDPNPP